MTRIYVTFSIILFVFVVVECRLMTKIEVSDLACKRA